MFWDFGKWMWLHENQNNPNNDIPSVWPKELKVSGIQISLHCFHSGSNHLRIESIFWKLSSGLSKRFVAGWRLHKRRSLSKDYNNNKCEQCCLIESARRHCFCLLAKRQRIWDAGAEQEMRLSCGVPRLNKSPVEAIHLRPLSKAFYRRNLFVLPHSRMCSDENLQIGRTNSLIYSMFLRNVIRQLYRSAGEVKISISIISVSLNNGGTWAASKWISNFISVIISHN